MNVNTDNFHMAFSKAIIAVLYHV